jgi:hypothetical protein
MAKIARIKHARQFADLPTPRHSAVIDEITNEAQSDRAVAIIGAAYFDLVLRDIIAAKLLPDAELMRTLFEDRGPLQDFGARIHLAYALRLFGRAAYDDLRVIKNIRNAFAHSAEAMDFNQPDVTRSCGSLCYPQMISVRNQPDPHTSRQEYLRAIELLTEIFLEDQMRQDRGMSREPLIMATGPRPSSGARKTVKK